ncbi:hypothetical protein G5V59_22650 [Nocardioides sp. W3-2-3]|uniref:hypothetical protein n=1 Tax=Nocardioides convexus TaxID=2712224 RepID=UPI0024189A8C|nr:hypothetical protein [Nocardioides convexus]NHA01619.1 hypothetical protein [Nocardioides convexus]
MSLREFDKVFQDALLCGGDEVLEAVYPVRSDLIDALYQTVWSGEHRLVDGTLRLALLAAMRQDLGYEDRGPEKERE